MIHSMPSLSTGCTACAWVLDEVLILSLSKQLYKVTMSYSDILGMVVVAAVDHLLNLANYALEQGLYHEPGPKRLLCWPL